MKNLIAICILTLIYFLETALKPNWEKANNFLGVRYPKIEQSVEPQNNFEPVHSSYDQSVDEKEIKALRVKYQYLPKNPEQAKKRLDFVLSELDRLILEYDAKIEEKKRRVEELQHKIREPVAKKEPLNDGKF